MFTSHALPRSVLLGSVAAIMALAPAVAADASRADAKRMLALYGHRAVAHGNTAANAAPASKDPMYTDLYKCKGGANDGCNPGAKVTFDPPEISMAPPISATRMGTATASYTSSRLTAPRRCCISSPVARMGRSRMAR